MQSYTLRFNSFLVTLFIVFSNEVFPFCPRVPRFFAGNVLKFYRRNFVEILYGHSPDLAHGWLHLFTVLVLKLPESFNLLINWRITI